MTIALPALAEALGMTDDQLADVLDRIEGRGGVSLSGGLVHMPDEAAERLGLVNVGGGRWLMARDDVLGRAKGAPGPRVGRLTMATQDRKAVEPWRAAADAIDPAEARPDRVLAVSLWMERAARRPAPDETVSANLRELSPLALAPKHGGGPKSKVGWVGATGHSFDLRALRAKLVGSG